MIQNKTIRYIAHNGEDQPASYNAKLGDKAAFSYAKTNARWWGGIVVAERADGSKEIAWPPERAGQAV